MQAAWYTLATIGRAAHPDLKVIFAMLAGGAPLHAERLEARGGQPIELGDPNTCYETSSYGPRAVDATARLVGQDQLLYAPIVLSLNRDQQDVTDICSPTAQT